MSFRETNGAEFLSLSNRYACLLARLSRDGKKKGKKDIKQVKSEIFALKIEALLFWDAGLDEGEAARFFRSGLETCVLLAKKERELRKENKKPRGDVLSSEESLSLRQAFAQMCLAALLISQSEADSFKNEIAKLNDTLARNNERVSGKYIIDKKCQKMIFDKRATVLQSIISQLTKNIVSYRTSYDAMKANMQSDVATYMKAEKEAVSYSIAYKALVRKLTFDEKLAYYLNRYSTFSNLIQNDDFENSDFRICRSETKFIKATLSPEELIVFARELKKQDINEDELKQKLSLLDVEY